MTEDQLRTKIAELTALADGHLAAADAKVETDPVRAQVHALVCLAALQRIEVLLNTPD